MSTINISFGMFEPAPGATIPGKHYKRPAAKCEPLQKARGDFGEATYRTVTVCSPGELIEVMQAAPPGSYITQGVAKDVGATRCVPAIKLKDNPGAFARANDHMIEPEAGALVTVDYDPPQYPDLAPENIPSPAQQIFEIAGNVFMVNRPSTSAFIADAETGELYHGERGRHINLAVEQGSGREEQLDRLHKKCVLHGWYWPKIDGTGKVTVTTIVDLALKRRVQPQFLAPVLAVGLVRATADGSAITTGSGSYLNIPALTAAEETEFGSRVAALPKRPGVVAQAAQNRRQYIAKLMAEGWDAESIKTALQTSTLRGDVPLHIRVKGKAVVVTVRDVLAAPSKYHGADALDPVAYLEPDYANNYCSKLYLTGQHTGQTIHSMAHGGRNFILVNDAVADFAAPLEADDEPADANSSEIPFDIDFPPGLVGEIARYVHRGSFKPIRSFGIASGLFAMSLMAGNRFYIAGLETSLNLYQILSAPTGSGKEAPRNRLKALFKGSDFMGRMWEKSASPTGLLRRINDASPHIFAMMPDEFGIELQSYSGVKADRHKKELVAVILALFNNARTPYLPQAYADSKDNIAPIDNPYFLLLGMTTPATLYPALTQEMVDTGAINRMLVIPAAGVEPDNFNPDMSVPDVLIKAVKEFATPLEFTQIGDMPTLRAAPDIAVQYVNGAEARLRELTDHIEMEGLQPEFWMRYREQVMRVAGVIAVGDGGGITVVHIDWAHKWVDWSVRNLARNLTPHLGEGAFSQLTVRAMDFITRARDYKADKQFSKFCRKGYMPHGKLLKLLTVPVVERDRVVSYLLESCLIKETTMDGFKVLFVPKM